MGGPSYLILNMAFYFFSYHNIIHDLVASIKKTEESLQRLKRFRKGVESNPQPSSDVSDENKIRQQLLLDVEQFGREVRIIFLCLFDLFQL